MKHLGHNGPLPAPVDVPTEKITAAAETASKASADGKSVLLFKTPTCPNCKAAMAMLDKAGVQYTVLDADEERELVMLYGIRQAPTLVVVDGEKFETFRGVSDIKGWLVRKAG